MTGWVKVALLAVAALGTGLYFGFQRSVDGVPEYMSSIKAEGSLGDISLPDVAGNTQQGDQWLGKVVVVNHWASWCPPCIKEIPLLIDFQQQYGVKGLQVVGIAHDMPEAARNFGDQIGITYPSLVIAAGGTELMISQGNPQGSALPFTAVFDRNGTLVEQWLGLLERDTLMKLITPYL